MVLRHVALAAAAAVLATLTAAAAPAVSARVIYGEDNRRDWYQLDAQRPVDAMALHLLENAIMVQTTRSALGSPDSNGVFRVLESWPESWRLGPQYNMCPGQRYMQQPTLGHCSATLVGPAQVITAGHCVKRQSHTASCSDDAYVFKYYVTGSDDDGDPIFPPITVSDVFYCASYVTEYGESGGADIALIQLDRPVVGRAPAPYHASPVPAVPGQSLMMIGFPSGLPAKIDDGGRVIQSGASTFVASTDAFGGNSGSGVFDIETGIMVGVLVNGATDYVETSGGCNVVNELLDSQGGEGITYVDRAVQMCRSLENGICDDGGPGADSGACDSCGADIADCGRSAFSRDCNPARRNSYVLLTDGRCDDVPGRERVGSEAECSQAALELGSLWSSELYASVTPEFHSGTSSNPPGCWFDAGVDRLYFSPGSQTGECSAVATCLCSTVLPSPPHPPSAPPAILDGGDDGASFVAMSIAVGASAAAVACLAACVAYRCYSTLKVASLHGQGSGKPPKAQQAPGTTGNVVQNC